jgi:YcxB-like protein
MMPALELRFTPTKDDYVQVVRAFYRHDWRIWLATGLTAVLFVTGIAYLVWGPEPPTLGVALLIALPAWAFYLAVLWPVQLSQQVQRRKELRSPTVWQLTEEHVLIRDLSGDQRFQWSDFCKVVETRYHYLLIFAVNRRAYAIAPKRALVSEQEALFRDIVARHLPGLRE